MRRRRSGVADRLPVAERCHEIPYLSREAARRLGGHTWRPLLSWAGEYHRVRDICTREVARAEARGQIGAAAMLLVGLGTCQVSLGSFAAARECAERARALIARIPGHGQAAFHVRTIDDDLRTALDERWEEALAQGQEMMDIPAEYRWLSASVMAGAARTFARLGYADLGLQFLGMVLPAIERGAGWAGGYTRVIFDAATTLWCSNEPSTSKSSSAVCGEGHPARLPLPDDRRPVGAGTPVRALRSLRGGGRMVRQSPLRARRARRPSAARNRRP